MNIIEEVRNIFNDVVKWRRHLHENPELSCCEFKTRDYISEALHSLGADEIVTVGETGLVGIIHGKSPGKVLGFRADTDALPLEEKTGLSFASKKTGVMHACGHDTHVASLLGAAKTLSFHRDLLKGSVKFIFQPCEEVVSGAQMMLKRNVLENPHVNAMVGLHANPSLPAGFYGYRKGVSTAASDIVKITVLGKQGHGAHPDECVDSIFIAANIICALQGLVSREMDPQESAVISICKIEGSKAHNIIPGIVEMSGGLRTFNSEVRKSMRAGIKRIAEGVAVNFRGKAVVEIEEGVPSILENEEMVDRFIKIAEQLTEKENIKSFSRPFMGGDDFAFFSQHVPSMMFRFGVGFLGKPNAPLHSEYFCVNEDGLLYSTAALVAFALDYLS